MENIILICYINVGGLTVDSVNKYMNDLSNSINSDKNGIISYFIPIKDGETRVECINPKLVSEEDFKEAKRVLDRNQEIVNDFIKRATYREEVEHSIQSPVQQVQMPKPLLTRLRIMLSLENQKIKEKIRELRMFHQYKSTLKK